MTYLKKDQNAKSGSNESEIQILTYQWGLLDDLGPVIYCFHTVYTQRYVWVLNEDKMGDLICYVEHWILKV